MLEGDCPCPLEYALKIKTAPPNVNLVVTHPLTPDGVISLEKLQVSPIVCPHLIDPDGNIINLQNPDWPNVVAVALLKYPTRNDVVQLGSRMDGQPGIEACLACKKVFKPQLEQIAAEQGLKASNIVVVDILSRDLTKGANKVQEGKRLRDKYIEPTPGLDGGNIYHN